jgi:hypothetical protein
MRLLDSAPPPGGLGFAEARNRNDIGLDFERMKQKQKKPVGRRSGAADRGRTSGARVKAKQKVPAKPKMPAKLKMPAKPKMPATLKMPAGRKRPAEADAAADDATPAATRQHPPTEQGQFRLQVDRQAKASYATNAAAEQAGLAIKKGHPFLHVEVFDTVAGVSKVIELGK